MKNKLFRQGLIVGVILLLIGTYIVPSIWANKGNIITVDDEPGDADFTLINEAVNYSSPGDIIEVYSGFYPEDSIRIVKDDITLIGISNELGGGDDSGKPFIKGNGSAIVIRVEASDVIVSNFRIENPPTKPVGFICCIFINVDFYPFYPKNVTISDCIISDSEHTGIYCYEPDGENIKIINNHISYCNQTGISINSTDIIMTGNVITDCREIGIDFRSSLLNVSGNIIRRCGIGIHCGGDNNILYGNDIENCAIGIQNGGCGTIITKNNLKNYSQNRFWFTGLFGERLFEGFKKSIWVGNYWDTWSGVGPKMISGYKILMIYLNPYVFIPIFIPWVDFDWHPANEPYDI
jgi:hypothetical protein